MSILNTARDLAWAEFQRRRLARIPGGIGENVHIDRRAIFQYAEGGTLAIGNEVRLDAGVLVATYGGDISIGPRTWVNPYAVLYGHGGLTIGADVLIAAHSVLIPANHTFTDPRTPIRDQGDTRLGIVIEDDAWLGTHAVVLDGVTVGRGAVIAAGAVVRSNVPAGAIVAGVPARIVGQR